jgi:hypothetical protein
MPAEWSFDISRKDTVGYERIEAEHTVGDGLWMTMVRAERDCSVVNGDEIHVRRVKDELTLSAEKLMSHITPSDLSFEEMDPVNTRAERVITLLSEVLSSNMEGWTGTYGAQFTLGSSLSN